jgi:hypothetical protein
LCGPQLRLEGNDLIVGLASQDAGKKTRFS